MEKIIEITAHLNEEKDTLDQRIAILNMPTANFCRKRGEMVEIGGRLEQACLGCVTQELKSLSRISIEEIKRIIDYFAKNYGTKFITVNGRGDPFEPRLRAETLEKVRYAAERWRIKAYVFTAGNELDLETCRTLVRYDANVMISLFGNRFIDADFFAGKKYAHSVRLLQDQAEITKRLRMLIQAYKESPNQPKEETTRIGMNYVVTESDLIDSGAKVKALKEAANRERIFFICNTHFKQDSNLEIQKRLERIAREYSDFHLRHSTAVGDQCQMGAGSSATIDYDGTLLRCPYLDNSQGQGKIKELSEEQRRKVLSGYMADRAFPCVMRKHQK